MKSGKTNRLSNKGSEHLKSKPALSMQKTAQLSRTDGSNVNIYMDAWLKNASPTYRRFVGVMKPFSQHHIGGKYASYCRSFCGL